MGGQCGTADYEEDVSTPAAPQPTRAQLFEFAEGAGLEALQTIASSTQKASLSELQNANPKSHKVKQSKTSRHHSDIYNIYEQRRIDSIINAQANGRRRLQSKSGESDAAMANNSAAHSMKKPKAYQALAIIFMIVGFMQM